MSTCAYTAFKAGCTWSDVNYSCAYDTAFMALYSIFIDTDDTWQIEWAQQGSYCTMLSSWYKQLAGNSTPRLFNMYRDALRDVLASREPLQFVRYGHALISISSVLQTLFSDNISLFSKSLCCSHCHSIIEQSTVLFEWRLPSYISKASYLQQSDLPEEAAQEHLCIQDFINVALVHFLNRTVNNSQILYDCVCGQTLQWAVNVSTIPSILYFEIDPQSLGSIDFTNKLEIPHNNDGCLVYRLAGIIYHGFNHFTARFIQHNGDIWYYDGMLNLGAPKLEGNVSTTSSNTLKASAGRSAHVMMFVRD